MNIEIGKISDRYTFLTHPTATAEILKLAREHPDYPITVLVSDEANSGDYGWAYATNVRVDIEEILDCNTRWWHSDYVCSDRDDFEEEAKDLIWDILKEKLGREPTNDEMETVWKEVEKAHEPYWKKCITIRADN